MRNKYHSKKIQKDGMTFDSKKEYDRFKQLQKLAKEGKIKNLMRQVQFPLLPSQKVEGRVVERPCRYIADFTYFEFAGVFDGNEEWRYVVEDAKGFRTKDYILKRKMMLWLHGIQIREV